jgi:predicted  nucleic acid-binding Zn-ribbon protein
MWIKINSEAINKLYFTDDFTGFLGKFADNAYDFKKVSDEFMENMLAALPVPTNSEMKSVYKTVYDLRKEVRDLKKEIKALRDEIEGLK